MNTQASVDAYRKTAVNSAVLDASPHRLVALMLAGIRERLGLAVACLETGDVARKGQAISEATSIITELEGSLDLSQGGEVADNLAALYSYAQRRLTESNAANDADGLREVDGLLADIESAWQQIDPDQAK
jgi:flagellar secretion chaperone FliS